MLISKKTIFFTVMLSSSMLFFVAMDSSAMVADNEPITFAEYEKYKADCEAYVANGNRPPASQDARTYAELSDLASLSKVERDHILQAKSDRKNYLEFMRLHNLGSNDPVFRMSLAEQKKTLDEKMQGWAGGYYYKKGNAFGFARKARAKKFLNKIVKEGLFDAIKGQKIPPLRARRLSIKSMTNPFARFYPESTLEGIIEKRGYDEPSDFMVPLDSKFWVITMLAPFSGAYSKSPL